MYLDVNIVITLDGNNHVHNHVHSHVHNHVHNLNIL